MTLIAFDLLRLDGEDLCDRPLPERRELLLGLGLDDVAWQVPPTYDDGQMLLDAAEQQGLEGIVSKRLSSRYRPGVRSQDWLKFPIRPTGSFVVGGCRHEIGSTDRLGAVLVGQPTADGPAFRGRVGSGIAGKAGRLLADLLTPRVVDDLAVRRRAAAARPRGHRLGGAVPRRRRAVPPAHQRRPAAPTGVPWRPHRSHPRGPRLTLDRPGVT